MQPVWGSESAWVAMAAVPAHELRRTLPKRAVEEVKAPSGLVYPIIQVKDEGSSCGV